MATAYTTSAKVLTHLPAGPPSSTTDKIADWIEERSRFADAFLMNYSTPLNAITASPPTPAAVETAVRYLVVDLALQDLKVIRREQAEPGSDTESWEARGMRLLEMLRDGRLVIPTGQLA